MKQGDIVVLPFPFTNLENTKLRPAVIISNKNFNSKKNIMVLAISTKAGDEDFSLPISTNDIIDGTLNKSSFIRFHNILSIEKRLVVKKVAKLNSKKLQEVLTQFKQYF